MQKCSLQLGDVRKSFKKEEALSRILKAVSIHQIHTGHRRIWEKRTVSAKVGYDKWSGMFGETAGNSIGLELRLKVGYGERESLRGEL